MKRVGDAIRTQQRYILSMNIKTALLAPTLILALAFPAMADKIPLKDLSGYLNSLSTAEADFTQINADG